MQDGEQRARQLISPEAVRMMVDDVVVEFKPIYVWCACRP